MGPMTLSFFISGCIVIPLGIYICVKLYNNVKNEECREKGSVVQRIMKTYSIIQCATWPLFLCLFGIANLFENDSIGKVIVVIITRFMFILTRTYTGFNSLVVAMCKYFFVVIEPMADTYDIKRARNILISTSFVVPIVFAILHDATVLRTKFWDVIFGLSCNHFESNVTNHTINQYSCEGNFNVTMQSPIYTFLNVYGPSQLVNGLDIMCLILFVMIRSNLIEGFIYTHIFIHDRR